MTFAQQLKSHRDRLQISTEQAASVVGYSRSTIEKWETGKYDPREIVKIAVLRELEKTKPEEK